MKPCALIVDLENPLSSQVVYTKCDYDCAGSDDDDDGGDGHDWNRIGPEKSDQVTISEPDLVVSVSNRASVSAATAPAAAAAAVAEAPAPTKATCCSHKQQSAFSSARVRPSIATVWQPPPKPASQPATLSSGTNCSSSYAAAANKLQTNWLANRRAGGPRDVSCG